MTETPQTRDERVEQVVAHETKTGHKMATVTCIECGSELGWVCDHGCGRVDSPRHHPLGCGL